MSAIFDPLSAGDELLLSEDHGKAPMTLTQCLDYLNMIAGNPSSSYGSNITVEALHNSALRDFPVMDEDSNFGNDMAAMITAQQAVGKHAHTINAIGDELIRLNGKKFIPLVTTASEANVAIALYAGDGIVMKITKTSELHGLRGPTRGVYTAFPSVLPPITSTTIGDYTVEMFPWVNTFGITDKDVQKMEQELAKNNLAFHPKDGKPNNIGRLPNGDLVVLDGDAVQQLDPSKDVPTHAINKWLDKVYSQFGELYRAPDPSKLISDNPNFALTFSPLLPKNKPKMKSAHESETVESISPADLKPTVKRGLAAWLGFGRGSSGS